MGLEKKSMDLGFGNFEGIMSLPVFEFIDRSIARLLSSFPSQLILLSVVRKKEYMKMIVGKVVENMAWGHCILLTG